MSQPPEGWAVRSSHGGVALFWGGRSVVQCGVADDEEPLGLGGADSPWAHDLPIGEPAPLPAAWTAAPVAPGESRGGNQIERVVPEAPVVLAVPGAPPQRADAPTPGHRHRRAALLIGVAALFAAAVVGSQLAGGGDDPTSDDDPAAAAPDSVDDGQVASTSSPSITVPRRTRLRPTTSIAEQLPPPPPEWVTSTVALDPRVAAIAAPTQLVALAGDGTLHVIDLSTGTMRSIDTGQSGANSVVSLGASDVLLSSYSSNSVTLARADVPPVEVAVEGGVGQVIQRAGTDDFILVPITWSPNSRDVLRLGSDAQVTLVSTGPLVQFDPWQIQFIRTTGQMIVNDAGGVYLVDENGVATRTSTGDLLSMGPNHYIVVGCHDGQHTPAPDLSLSRSDHALVARPRTRTPAHRCPIDRYCQRRHRRLFPGGQPYSRTVCQSGGRQYGAVRRQRGGAAGAGIGDQIVAVGTKSQRSRTIDVADVVGKAFGRL